MHEHLFFDRNPMHQRSDWQTGRSNAHPVAEHSARANKRSRRGKVKRVTYVLVGPSINEDLIIVNREGVSMKPPKVPPGCTAQEP